jgi:autotransporter-associated beta strand protein
MTKRFFWVAGALLLGVAGWYGWDSPPVPHQSLPAATRAVPGANRPPPALAPAAALPPGAAVVAPATASAAAVPPRRRSWDSQFLASLKGSAEGSPIRFELVGGELASGTIRHLERRAGALVYVAGELAAPEAGRFFFQTQTLPGRAGDFVGVIEFPASQRAYRIEPSGTNGTAELVERALAQVVCRAVPPPAPLDPNHVEEVPPLDPQDVTGFVPAYNDGIIALESLPGATGVLYIDYRGGYTPTWGGITYARPTVSNAQIKEVWKRVAEDYLPFKVNVTTDARVFQNAPENSRQRCVVTPTSTAAPGAGGVAYLQSWNWTGDTPCWVFMTTGKSCAEAISHEVGHTLWLGHDGQDVSGTHTEYYGGQGSGATGWAPIMGVGYYQPVSQWSKGEYANANNTEDDLTLITTKNNNAPYRVDDTGATLATSRYLEIYGYTNAFGEGVLERTGDTDAFQFTTTGGQVALSASPVGDWGNLALQATLANAAGAIIASNNPQTQLTASLTTNLPAGTYTFRVTGAGRNTALTDGFSAYASLGYYSITGAVFGARAPTRFSVVEHAPAGTAVGTVPAPNNTNANPLAYALVAGNTGTTFAIDANGLVRVANNAWLDYRRLATNTQYAVRFELFVNITNRLAPALTELNRRVVIAVLDVNDPPVVVGFNNTILAHTRPGVAVGTVSATDRDFAQVLSYSLVSGNGNGMFAIDQTGVVTVAGDPDAATQNLYTLGVAVSDNGLPVPLVTTGAVTLNVVANATAFQPGSIGYACYDNIGSGTLVSDLTNNARFPADPTAETQKLSLEGDTNRADNYGSVMRGYLIAPLSGSYTFWIATDDSGELWMSTSTNPAARSRIAYISNSWAGPRDWNKIATQKSTARTLIAGQGYYLEARQKEGGGGDNLAVAWKGPATANLTNVIAGQYLAPCYLNYVPHATGFTNSVRRDTFAGARVGQVTVVDVNAGQTNAFTILSGNAEGIFALDGLGWLRVTDEAALQNAAAVSYTLAIRVTDSGTPPLSSTCAVALTIAETNLVVPTSLQREMFYNLGSGTAVTDLTGNPNYPGQPDALVALARFASPVDVADSYGSRLRGYVTPPLTGDYRFFLASDDSSQLKFSLAGTPAGAVVIAAVNGYSGTNEWTKFTAQASALQTALIAGERYYLEALQKEGGGGDHVAVAWAGPGLTGTNVIDTAYLTPADINEPPRLTNQTIQLFSTVGNGTLIGNVSAVDSPLDTLTFKIVDGNTNAMFGIAPDTGGILVLDNTLIADGTLTNVALTVAVQDSGYGGRYPLRTSQATVTLKVVDTNAPLVWTGAAGTNNWASGGNWGGALPGTGTRVIFGYTSQQSNYNDVATALPAVQFTTGGFNISGNPLTLQSGLTNSGANTWALNTTLGASQTWLNSSGTFTLNGAVTNASNTLTLSANADIQLNGPVSGAGGLTKTGTARLLLQGAHPYTGPTTIASAGSSATALQLSGPADLALGGSDLTLSGRMDLVNHNATVGALNGSGTIFANDLPQPLLTVGANGHNGNFTGVIQDNTTSGLGITLGLVKTGAGNQTFSGANTFSGGTVIRAGQIALGSATALGTGAVTLGDAGTGTNAVGLLAAAAVTANNNLVVAPFGTGPVTLGTSNFSPSTANCQFGGTLSLGRDVTLQAGVTNRTTFAGRLTGTGNVTVTSPFVATRRVVFDRPAGDPNDFVGDLIVGTNAWLQLGNTDSLGNRTIPDACAVKFHSGGRLRLAPTGTGDTETLGTLNSLVAGAGTVELFTGTAFTLVLGSGNQSGFYSGTIGNSVGSLALTKIGAGTQTLAGGDSFAGLVTIHNGVLVAASASALGASAMGTVVNAGGSLALTNNIALGAEPLTLNGTGFAGAGALRNDGGNNVFNGLLTFGTPATIAAPAGSLALGGTWNTAGQTVTFDTAAGASVVVDGALGGAGAVVKTNAGTLVFNGANYFSGPLTIDGGAVAFGAAGSANLCPSIEVQARATLDATLLAAGLTIPAGQTLRGNGTVLGNVLVEGTLLPGPAWGTLTFSHDLALAGTTCLAVNKNGTTFTNHAIAVAGALTFGGALSVTNTGAACLVGDVFQLFTAAPAAGGFASFSLPSLEPGCHWDLSQLAATGRIAVAPIAAPQLVLVLEPEDSLGVQVPSELGLNYVLQWAPALEFPVAWGNVSTNAGTGQVLMLTLPVELAAPGQFFRVLVY